LRLRRLQPGYLTLALRHQLVAVEPRDDVPLLDGVALIHGALRQPPGGLERDVDFRQLDVPETTMRPVWLRPIPRNAYIAATPPPPAL